MKRLRLGTYEILASGMALLLAGAATIASADSAQPVTPPVKKSNERICYEASSPFYKTLKVFAPYPSLESCVNSGGRLSGNPSRAAPSRAESSRVIKAAPTPTPRPTPLL